jgi:pimeloyl-ACP methyl ester carboxylesterase
MTEHHRVDANGIVVHVVTAGQGPAVLLLHGWPHTWFLWRKIIPVLAQRYRVIAPDLRGLGHTTRSSGGYDLHTLANDADALLDALAVPDAAVVGIDLGAPIAWMLAMLHPGRVRKLAVMESLLGTLPGAERFLAHGAPWWFAFHAIPGLAETVVEGNEAAYLDHFFATGTAGGRGIDPEARAAFVQAYTGREALRGGFAHYRAFAGNAAQIRTMAAARRTTVPTLAIAGGVVGDALHGQLVAICDDLAARHIAGCGHLIPEEQPEALATMLMPFVA